MSTTQPIPERIYLSTEPRKKLQKYWFHTPEFKDDLEYISAEVVKKEREELTELRAASLRLLSAHGLQDVAEIGAAKVALTQLLAKNTKEPK